MSVRSPAAGGSGHRHLCASCPRAAVESRRGAGDARQRADRADARRSGSARGIRLRGRRAEEPRVDRAGPAASDFRPGTSTFIRRAVGVLTLERQNALNMFRITGDSLDATPLYLEDHARRAGQRPPRPDRQLDPHPSERPVRLRRQPGERDGRLQRIRASRPAAKTPSPSIRLIRRPASRR